MAESELPDIRPEFLIGRPSANVLGNKIPPPRKTDVLFRGAYDDVNAAREANACINIGFPAGDAYRHGYRAAALALAREACENRAVLDTYVYPIIYLYRHAVEMTLKRILQTSHLLLTRTMSESTKKALKSHNLKVLWDIARPLVKEVCQQLGNSPFPEQDLEGIGSYIKQMHKHDPAGESFRYSLTIEHKPSLPDAPHNINIAVVYSAMEILCSYLDSIESWFDTVLSQMSSS